jgi:HSP20 family protein
MLIRPDTDVVERDDGLYVYANLPGVAHDALHLEVEGNVLYLRAETSFGSLPGGRLHALEFDEARYEGEMALPDTVEKKGISAMLAGGVLTVFLPFVQREGPRRIPVIPA